MARSSRRTHEEHNAARDQAERQEVLRRTDDGETIAQIAKGMAISEYRVRELRREGEEARRSTAQTDVGVYPSPHTPPEERRSGVAPSGPVAEPEPEPTPEPEKPAERGGAGDDARR